MAGNKNPWRDILTVLEWQMIVLTAGSRHVPRAAGAVPSAT